MNAKKQNAGFSLLEILAALAIFGLLTAFGLNGFSNWSASAQVREAQHNLAQAINKARSDSRRTSVDQKISWTLSPPSISIAGKAITLPNSVVLTGPTDNNFSYVAPYGRTDKNQDWEFTLKNKSGVVSIVRVQGVTGRVVRVVSN